MEAEEKDAFDGNGGTLNEWERRVDGESPKAFKAFCLFRNMGYRRSIKACLELNKIEMRKYGTWSRYSRLFRWKERAALFDEHMARETEKEILCERVERRRRHMEMLDGFDNIVRKRIETLDPGEIDADGAMDLLERSARLDSFIAAGTDKKDKACGQDDISISFVGDFKGL